jgi:protein gp37
MAETHIEWTHRGDSIGVTWNPTTGCDQVSAGCDNCYALTMAKRLKAMGQAKYQADGDPRTSGPGFGLTVHEDMLALPYKWRKPRTVFVNSMSDLFHAKVPRDFIRRVFDVMADTPQHTYQILTKRSLRLRRLAGELEWPDNVWMGVSVESAEPESLIRIEHLSDTPAQVKFLSCEPLIADPGTIELASIDWVICGGESGAGCRPMEVEWARSLLLQCQDAYGPVPFFMKQMGSVWARDWCTGGKSVAAHGDPKGGDPQYWPADLRVRQYPQPAGVSA